MHVSIKVIKNIQNSFIYSSNNLSSLKSFFPNIRRARDSIMIHNPRLSEALMFLIPSFHKRRNQRARVDIKKQPSRCLKFISHF